MSTAYDSVIYPNLCLPQTHPTRLAVLANLFGLDPAPPERCRVLEIGCGDGGNLLPLAVQFPESHFTGFDLAESRIALGRKSADELSLANLELSHANIMDFPLEGEPYDYIIAHGIYSWIPAEVRKKLLAIYHGRLATQGVGYISYNCFPGCHIRQMAREIMRFHIRTVEESAEKIRQAKAVCQLIANSVEKPDSYRQIFKEQLEQIERFGSNHLFHDDLADINQPFYFHEFASQAACQSLQYLAEADFFEMQDIAFSSEARAILGQMKDSRLTQEQYLDFVKCRRFRQTLVCHAEARIKATPQASAIERFHISSQAKAEPAGKGPRGGPLERYSDPKTGILEFEHPLGIRALRLVIERWPATVFFPDLFQAAANGDPAAATPEARAQLQAILLEAYRAGLVDFRRTPVRCATAPSTRPSVSHLARWQITRFPTITTLRNENLRVEDTVGQQLLQMLDGSKTWAELADGLPEECRTGPEAPANVQEKLETQLKELARLALLEA